MDPQALADQLAHELARSVAVATIDREIVGISYAAADQPTLFNAARPALPETLHEWARSGSTGPSADPDGWTELPLSAHGIRSGFVLLADNGRALQAHEHTLLELAATVLAAAHGITGELADIREVGFRLLLSYDPAERRAALHRARARRWVTAAGPIAVHALLFDDQSGTLSRQLSLQRICRRLPANVDVLRERGNVVFLLSRSTHDDIDVDTLVRTAATEAGLPLAGVGSATVHAEDEDLARAAHAAETAAEINVAVPELAGNTRADRLGGWALLHAVSAQRDLLSVASPAAAALCAAGEGHRETVETYLDNAGQVRETCDRLHIHRTTLYYRLDNLPPVVKDALADGMQRSTLHLALKLDRLWAASAA